MTHNLERGLAKVIKDEFGLKRVDRIAIHHLMEYLDSKDVVRKVEGEFPQFQSRLTEKANIDLLIKQGWSKTERLI